jgi:hypothetical protein
MKKLIPIAAVAIALLLALTGCINLANVSPGGQTAKTSALATETPTPLESAAPTEIPTEFIEVTATPEGNTTDTGMQNGAVFTAKSGRFSAEFPQGWQVIDSSTSAMDMVQSQYNDNVAAFIEAVPIPGITEDQYQAIFDSAMNAIAQDISITHSGTDTFKGQPAHYYEFTGTTSGTNMHCAICFIAKDSVMYTVIFVSPEDQFDTYSDTFGQIFNSFQFLT